MRRTASFVAILLLFLTAAPVVVCATDGGMTHQESACCRSMHGDCGEMARTGCCQTKFRVDAHPQLAAAAPQVKSVEAFVEWIDPVLIPTRAIAVAVLRPAEHSPPGSLIAKLAVLRI